MAITDWLLGRKGSSVSALRPPLHPGGSLFGDYFDASYRLDHAAGRSYGVLVREAYERNAIAQRAVRIVAEGVGGAPLACADDHMIALATETSAGQSLLETLAAQLLLHGNAFVRIIQTTDGNPAELFALRPDRVTIEAGADGWPVTYVYGSGETAERFDAQPPDGRAQVVHIKSFHPTDDLNGMGCLGAAAEAVAVHNAAARWNRALLANGARPSGALIYDPGDGLNLSEDQFRRLKEELAANFSGETNSGRPLILDGGLKWQTMSLTPADMDFAALKAAAAREIALAFGVPPMLLGLPGDNSYANYREANKALWRLTLLPLAGKILGALSEALSGWFANASLAVDLDRLPALSEDRERLWSQVSTADFLTREEKRGLLGFE